MKQPRIYTLTITDMSHASDRMGLAHTSVMDTLHFSSVEKAKEFALTQYRGSARNSNAVIQWKPAGRDRITSGDLLWVMYDIEPLKVRA